MGHDLRQLRPAPRRRVSVERQDGASAAASASPICRATPASSRARPTTAPRTSPRACRSCRTARTRAACRPAASRIPCRSRRRSAAIPTRRRSTASARRGSRATSRTAASMQWNLFVERTLFDTYLVSIGYSASVSRDLINRSFPIQNLQSIVAGRAGRLARSVHREQRHAESRPRSRCRTRIRTAASPLPFAGPLAAQTIARQNTLVPVSAADRPERGDQLDRARPPTITRCSSTSAAASASGLMFDAQLHVVEGHRQLGQSRRRQPGLQRGRQRAQLQPARSEAESAPRPERRAAPLRGVVSLRAAVRRRAGSSARRGLLKHLAGGWQLGGSVIWQSGFPIGISGASTGAALARPDRVDGVDFEVPKDLQRWYDGRTTVTLPSGRRITPPANTFLKYNPDAFAGRVVTDAERPHRRRSVLVRERAAGLRRDPHRSAVQHRPDDPPHRSASRRA